jgi:hypothetical protein
MVNDELKSRSKKQGARRKEQVGLATKAGMFKKTREISKYDRPIKDLGNPHKGPGIPERQQ